MTAPSAASRYRIHGLPVRLQPGGVSTFASPADSLLSSAARLLHPFAESASGPQSLYSRGTIKPFNNDEVLRSVTSAAACVGRVDKLAELFALDERFWLVDERWGICQLNLLKHEWRSWVLDRPALDSTALLESAVLWPLAQLLKIRGVELIPAISILRGGWAALILSPYGIDREISRLQREGYTLIGPRWTALAARDDGVMLLPFPDPRSLLSAIPDDSRPPQIRRSKPGNTAQRFAHDSRIHEMNHEMNREIAPPQIVLTKNPLIDGDGGLSPEALCQAVFIIEPGRRAVTRGRTLASGEGTELLRRAWPIAELPPGRKRPRSVPGKLACQCRCVSVQLSRQEEDFFQLVESARRRCQDARKLKLSLGNLSQQNHSRNKLPQHHESPRKLRPAHASGRLLYGGIRLPSASIARPTPQSAPTR
jgi:hypothetical protein